MNKTIIIINGSGGVGKDTFVEYCSEFANVKNISTVDKVKEAANILVGWSGERDEKSRKLLSDLKKMSVDYNDSPTKYIEEQSELFFQDENLNIMFVHIREIEEIKKAKELLQKKASLKAKTLLITSKRVEKITSNYSDANVDKYEYDYYVTNDGTLDELRGKAEKFVEELCSNI